MDIQEILNSDEFLLDTSDLRKVDWKKIQETLDNLDTENPFYELEFTYDGTPKPAPRPRKGTMRIGKGENQIKVERWYDPGEKDKKAIRKYVKSVLPDDYDPIDAEAYILIKTFKPMIKAFSKVEKFLAEARILRPDKKPDVDNYAKTVMDAINGVVWTDDGRVVDLHIEKFYSVIPRVEVTIRYRKNRLTNK
jgi:Holliday junction resolvase RusA-like endonuclease